MMQDPPDTKKANEAEGMPFPSDVEVKKQASEEVKKDDPIIEPVKKPESEPVSKPAGPAPGDKPLCDKKPEVLPKLEEKPQPV